MGNFEKIFLVYSVILAVFLTVSVASPLQFLLLPLPIYFGWVIFSEIKSRRKGSSRGLGHTFLDKKGLFISLIVFVVLLSIGFTNVRKPQAETKGLSIVAEQETTAPPEQEAPTKTEPQNEIIEVRVGEDGFVNIREEPNTTAAKLGTAKNGQQYPLLGTQDNWYEILFDGTHAFINKEFAAPPKEQK